MSRRKQQPTSKQKSPQAVTAKPSRWQHWLVFIVPVLLYANTIGHEYAVDDDIVIVQNTFTQRGLAGIGDIFTHDAFDGATFLSTDLLGAGRYRPVSIATFAIEHEFFGGNAQVSHFLNVLLFGLTCVMLFLFLQSLLRDQKPWLRDMVPLFAALIFAAHPIHTEVVANIKGRDEILALLFGLLAMRWALKYSRDPAPRWLLLSAAGFFVALFSKESVYPLVAVVPLIALTFFNGKERRRLVTASGVLFMVALIGFGVRTAIVGFSTEEANNLMNNPFLEASSEQRLATIVYVLGRYLQLLFFPHPLTNDYYPYHIELHDFGGPVVLGTLAVIVVFGALALWLTFLKRHVVGFAILFLFITLSVVSNIILPVGTFMSERLAFIPSVGFCLGIGWFLAWIGRNAIGTSSAVSFARDLFKKNAVGAVLLLVIVTGYGFKTVTRNGDWKNSHTLFLADADVSTNSAKANNAAGGTLYEMAQAEQDTALRRDLLLRSKQHLLKAVQIYPLYQPAWMTLGNDYYFLDNNVDSAIACYERAGPSALQNLRTISKELLSKRQFNDAIKGFTALNRMLPNDAEALVGLGQAYGQGLNDLTRSISFLSRAVEVAPNNVEALKQLGTAHALRGEQRIAAGDLGTEAIADVRTALTYYLRAYEFAPNDRGLCGNIANVYARLGNDTEAQRFRALAGAN